MRNQEEKPLTPIFEPQRTQRKKQQIIFILFKPPTSLKR
jgi:hypothetical protein